MILARGFQRFVLDLDGVVWTGEEPIPGAPETIRALRDAGRRFAFVTNNSSQPASVYAAKLVRMGAGGEEAEIVTSADATARLLSQQIPDLRGRTAYVIGGPGLRDAVAGLGVHLLDGEQAVDVSMVVVGLDVGFTYDKLRIATTAIRSGALFVASNEDATLPVPGGLLPGGGAIVAALRTATGTEPLVAGKPSPLMLEVAAARAGSGPALVVGDRVSTDVAAARALGMPSALVLTGATGLAELAAAPYWPDAILRSLSDLLVELPHPGMRSAAGPDLAHIAALLHGGGLQAGNVRERASRTVCLEDDRGTILGTAAWDPAGEHALIRSVVVAPEWRGKAVGLLAVAGALRSAVQAGARQAWLVTTTAETFFARCGFVSIDREDAPPEVLGHPHVSRECPSTAALMRLRLPAADHANADGDDRRGRSNSSSSMPATNPPMWAK